MLENENLLSHVSTTYGLCWDSILNSSKFFHITEGLPPDIMHDILEGSLQYEMKELLKYLIEEKGFLTLDVLNEKIEQFPYMQSDVANKPAPIPSTIFSSKAHNVKQKGIYMYILYMYMYILMYVHVHVLTSTCMCTFDSLFYFCSVNH